MSATLWFTTKSNAVLRHALSTDERATCNSGISPHLFPVRDADGHTTHYSHDGAPASELPEYAQLCPRCSAVVAEREQANQDKFSDWDEAGTELQLDDNGDSISFTISLTAPAAVVEVSVRIRPEDLDRVERRIAWMRAERGI
jgi:hypothetical protein